jgi:hypothetical protein
MSDDVLSDLLPYDIVKDDVVDLADRAGETVSLRCFRALDKKWRTEWYNGTRALLSGDRLGFDLAAHHLHLSRPWKSAPEGWPDRIEAALAAMPERS